MNVPDKPPHLPVIIAGLSAAGKSTIALGHESRQDLPPHERSTHFTGKYFSRPARPAESEGRDGFFGRDIAALKAMEDAFLFYELYGQGYVVPRGPILARLDARHVTIIGGEIDISNRLKAVMNAQTRDMNQALQAVTVFIHRPLAQILASIEDRPASADEKKKRREHVERAYAITDAGACDYLIDNKQDAIHVAVEDLRAIINGEVLKQLQARFGHEFTIEDYAGAHPL